MTRRLTIALDCDGVLAHFTETFRQFAAPWATDDQIDRWDIVEALGLPNDTYARFGAAVGIRGLCIGIPRYSGARDFVLDLQRDHEVYAVTAPFNAEWLTQRADWLLRLGIDLAHQVHTHAKHRVRADVLIDDRPEHCASFPGRAILFDQPWNRRAALPANGVRCVGYAETLAEIRRLAE
jgi:5'(3')-deoxyribonucleotidase